VQISSHFTLVAQNRESWLQSPVEIPIGQPFAVRTSGVRGYTVHWFRIESNPMVDDRTALMSARALSPGYEILWYTIDRVLGQGGFGITYLAHDRNLDRAVAIKEYLPISFAYRHQDYSVKPITGDHRQNFVWGLGSFLKEAKTLARFSHPNIVRVHSVFEANNTAYMVMEYEHGQNLAAVYKESDKLEQPFFEQVFFPIFNGLKEIHKFEFIHRDIKPANIYIREDGTPVLIDFGSARQTTQQQTSEITTLVSQGYTPLEQYSANYGDQGPWTDIYALAATIYEGVVGRKPDESLSRSACLMRSKPDLLEQLDARVYLGFSQRFLNAVFAGLKLEPEGRPQSLEEWYRGFEHGDDTFISQPQAGGFTELESDRTRIQPRPPSPEPAMQEFDSFTELESGRLSGLVHGSPQAKDTQSVSRRLPDRQDESFTQSYRPGSKPSSRADTFSPRSQPVATADRAPVDELLSFDDDDLVTDSQTRIGNQVATKSKPSQHRKGIAKKRTGRLLAAVTALLMLVAGGAYYVYDARTSTPDITAATLSTMPRPPQSTVTVLPEESALSQLDHMVNLAPLLAQAYELNGNDPGLLDTIRATEASLLSLATKWNATRHADIASRISAVSGSLPAAVHDQNRIQGILSAASQVSAYAQVLALLDDGRYLRPAGNCVLDRITSVSASDYQQLKNSAQWRQMMSEFTSAALDKLARSEFDEVSRLTEAALTLDTENPGFNALRTFLAGS
jgi:serine/threonine protein kinase